MALPVDLPPMAMTGQGGDAAGHGDTVARGYLPALIITVSLFFLWGMANNLNDILIAQFRKAFTLSDFGTSFVQQVFYLGYFLLAVPASMVMRRYGYKAAIVLGLTLYGTGALLFYPAAAASLYQLFLLGLFVIAAGLAFLETSANPLMGDLGDPAGATRRLNWAQAANPLGAITGILIGRFFILSGIEHDERALATMDAAARTAFYKAEVQAIAPPYVAIAIVVLLFAVAAALVRFPSGTPVRAEEGRSGRFVDVFRQPRLMGAVVAQFFYVGAQVGVWSYTIRYAQANVGLNERGGADALFVSLVLFAAGRFLGSALMGRAAPVKLLALFAGLSVLLTAMAAVLGGWPGLIALVAASFFMSIQFPTIFALGIEGLGPLRRAGASLIVMAIIGGAGLTALMGLVSDHAGITSAMLVPTVSFVVVTLFALMLGRRKEMKE
ncbi:L-fucose:H+ symporter permease [Sphingomonas yabuuchiae]|uniref:FHS family L-fucose permease-like MFS transporter n=2 Tax=Sphingomonas yabuuchiae TaxID=172044 RepID=A0ABR6K7S7_9SPHN|nr:L-fucose:H+ symporter permease [Sphingomonas yabuuchiae]MBB4609163.1 FHS family L-fucose permease-like MFS transporter [Sphingomonas yabuuchiae]